MESCHKGPRNTITIERNQALFKHYESIIEKYGKIANRMSKESLYEEAAEPFFICPKVAGRIIRAMLKERHGHKVNYRG